ncbi:MAG: energy-coupling factor transporter ATPase [Clostridiales bacterium]|nr:energy-coupling factor transporter ATPase [Clostridiales bacterium]
MLSVIKTEHLTHLYSIGTPFEKAAINDVNIEISQGEFVGVIGHTGSGKSTLIQHFNGLLKPTSGKIYLDGKDIWADKSQIRSVRFQVGLVFQYPEYQLFEETVYKDIAFGPKNMGLSDEEVDLRVRESAALVGLKSEILNKSPFELSGGQKRRVAIAGVIAMQPKVLILDEPTAGLDPRGRDLILSEIQQYHQEKKNTILLVSHSMEDIAKYASKVLVMNHAEVYAYDTVEKVFSRVKQLRSLGLDVPQITRIFYQLKERGVDIDTNVYSVEHAKELILEKLKKAGGAQ